MKKMRSEGLVTIKEIEGMDITHDSFLKGELARRKEPLDYLDDVAKLAEYIGGEPEEIKPGDWAIGKEAFPGVMIHFVFQQGDEEMPSNLRVLFSIERAKNVPGEDLVELALAYANHMLRYIRDTNPDKELPRICYQV